MKFAVSHDAAELIRRCGGELYVWSGPREGELSCSAGVAPPGKEWRRHSRPELDLYVEAGLKGASGGIEIALHRFPRKRLQATRMG